MNPIETRSHRFLHKFYRSRQKPGLQNLKKCSPPCAAGLSDIQYSKQVFCQRGSPMALDFLQVREKVKAIGENAALRERQRQNLREEARRLLDDNAQEVERLREKIELAARSYDPTPRCALPVQEPLNAAVPPPEPPPIATIIAADGSQINPDRNAPVDYCLINVGAIQMVHGLPDPPAITLKSDL